MSCEIIAELSTSHGGDRAWQERLIESAALAGADFVKFQSYQVRHLSPSDPQFVWMKQAELSDKDHKRLIAKCAKCGVKFLTTPFHEDRVEFLHDLGLPAIKIGSGEAMRPQMLEAVSHYDWTVYLSTGLLTLDELDRALGILDDNVVVVMHTVSQYPTQLKDANMTRMAWLALKTGRQVGYSDHTIGSVAAEYAVAQHAAAVEVHHSIQAAPRFKPWDKDWAQLKRICEFRGAVDTMTAKGPMMQKMGERPYVGRWTA